MAEVVSPAGAAIEYADGQDLLEGWLVTPTRLVGPRPGLLLAPAWSGLTDGMKQVARRLAGLGYPCFLLDVYGKGVQGVEDGDNSHLMAPLLADRGLLRRRLLAGLTAAADQPAIEAGRLAAVGYCFGGLCALDLARAVPAGLRAAVSFHGLLTPPGLGPQPPIEASVLILHGWDDPMAPPADVLAVAQEMTAAGADWQLHAYGHALHAFTFEDVDLPERGLAYDAAADRRSWATLGGFLGEVFGGVGGEALRPRR